MTACMMGMGGRELLSGLVRQTHLPNAVENIMVVTRANRWYTYMRSVGRKARCINAERTMQVVYSDPIGKKITRDVI